MAFMIAMSAIILNHPPVSKTLLTAYEAEDVVNLASGVDFSRYKTDGINEPSTDSGGLPEKIKGNENAPVIIYEYADYACSHCAEMNTEINRIYREYSGKVAVVFRNYVLGFKNSVNLAAAANAADIQGYWEGFKNKIFSEQAVWYSMSGAELKEYLGEVFMNVSNNKGDLDKFFEDTASTNVIKKLAFDHAAGDAVELTGTPHFRINGEKVASNERRKTIDAILAEKGL